MNAPYQSRNPETVAGSGAPSRTPPPPGATHWVKRTYEIPCGPRKTTGALMYWYVWECICGSSSAMHQSATDANASYERHKRGY